MRWLCFLQAADEAQADCGTPNRGKDATLLGARHTIIGVRVARPCTDSHVKYSVETMENSIGLWRAKLRKIW